MDDTALVADSEDKLQKLVEFGRVCERRKVKVNVNSSKVMHWMVGDCIGV